MLLSHEEHNMARWMMVALCALAGAAAGCQQEVISERPSSFVSQFQALNNKNGWVVNGADSAKSNDPMANARVVKEANFSNLTFSTTFQVDDPKVRGQPQTQPATMPARNASPTGMPFGAPVQ
jgi:hypothetical protein